MAEGKTGEAHGKGEELVGKDAASEEPERHTDDSDEPGGIELKQAMDSAELEVAEPTPPKHKGKGSGRRFSRKQIVLIAAGVVALLLAVVFVVPVTRYGVLGLFVKRDVTVVLHDSKTNKPVSGVAVGIAGQSVTTNAQGAATFKAVPVGGKTLTTHKKYYKDSSTNETVPLTGGNPSFSLTIQATGRQVPVKILNKISQQPLSGAMVTADGTSSQTDKNGEAIIVLPADKSSVDATVTLNGYNNASATIIVTEQQSDKNTFTLTPAGKLYFLSKRSGTIDVMKSDLDGANPQVVLKGTGNEDDRGTILLASRDWKYLALLAQRDSSRPEVYVIDTSTDKMMTIDEGDVAFTFNGWSGDTFIYTVNRDKLDPWAQKQYALKAYDASTNSLKTLDETTAAGSNTFDAKTEVIANVYLLNNQIVYTKSWLYSQLGDGQTRSMSVDSIRPDGSGRTTLKAFIDNDVSSYFGSIALTKPQDLYFEITEKGNQMSWEYDGSKITQVTDFKGSDFYKYYPTYLISPSGNASLWFEQRDGQNAIMIGDGVGNNAKELLTLDSTYVPYGWYSDDYILVSKNSSELYVISRANPGTPLKITDYHKPQVNFYGYGYGYGGF